MKKLNCHLIVRETQSASAKILEDLKKEDEDINIEEIFNEALKNDENKSSTKIIGEGTPNNPQNSKV